MFVYFAPQSELNSSDSIFSKHERKEERERERREKKERRRERKEKKLRKLQLQKNVSSSTEESPKVGTYAEFVIYIFGEQIGTDAKQYQSCWFMILMTD